MKRNLPIIKNRYISIAISLVLLLVGIVCFFLFDGFNKGIDFESGLSEQIQIAPVGLKLSYVGDDDLTLSVSANHLVLTKRGVSGVKVTEFSETAYPLVDDIAKALSLEQGIAVEVVDGSLKTADLVSGFGFPATLSSAPISVNFASPGTDVTIDQIRDALKGRSVNVQTVGALNKGIFLLKLSVQEGDTQDSMENDIKQSLSNAFSAENVVILQSDFVGPKFSSTLISSSIKAVLIAVLLILAYIWIRFRFSYAISAIIALLHDVLMMLSFIVVFRLEVSSTTIAAVLTIIGYSLNNTIVIFDRIRENVQLYKSKKIDECIDFSVTQSLTRTVITSLTTLFAVVPLAIFSTGAIQLFAYNLVWGIIAGTYSSNFLAPAFLHWFNKVKPINVEKIKKPEVSPDSDFA